MQSLGFPGFKAKAKLEWCAQFTFETEITTKQDSQSLCLASLRFSCCREKDKGVTVSSLASSQPAVGPSTPSTTGPSALQPASQPTAGPSAPSTHSTPGRAPSSQQWGRAPQQKKGGRTPSSRAPPAGHPPAENGVSTLSPYGHVLQSDGFTGRGRRPAGGHWPPAPPQQAGLLLPHWGPGLR